MSSEAIESASVGIPVMWAIFGGVLPEIAEQYKLRTVNKEDYPDHYKSFRYWAWTVVMVLIGAVFVFGYAYSGVKFNFILSMNVGASAPLLIQKLVGSIPDIDLGKISS